jgi:hypothetical protein
MNRISEETRWNFNSDHNIHIFGDKLIIKWRQNVYIWEGYVLSNDLELELRGGTRLQKLMILRQY